LRAPPTTTAAAAVNFDADAPEDSELPILHPVALEGAAA
jgi:hypothetical protein